MEFPYIGIGTYKLISQEQIDFVLNNAFSCGYKMIDTAELYKNQHFIGNYLEAHPEIKREEIWITSKVSFRHMKKGEKHIIEGIEKTFEDLKTSYIDLYLIHAPIESGYLFAWNKLRSLQKEGKIRHIGVSNFTVEKLEKFIELIGDEEAKFIFCNQIEYSPFLNRNDLVELCHKNNIIVTAYGSLYKSNEVVKEIAEKLDKTESQVMLKWTIDKKIRIIPMSQNPGHIKENIGLDFEISSDDASKLDGLNENFSLYSRYL